MAPLVRPLTLLALAWAPAARGQECTPNYTVNACNAAALHIISDNIDSWDTYTCSTGTWDGGEMIYQWTPQAGQQVEIAVNAIESSYDIDLLVTEDKCGSGSCKGSALSNTDDDGRVRFTADGSTYYVAVDEDTTDGTYNYRIEFGCPSSCDPGTHVLEENVLTCSSDFANLQADASDVLNYYSCPETDPDYPQLVQLSSETVYQFTPQATGAVTFNLTGKQDHDIYVLEDTCDPWDQCISSSTKATGDDSVTFNAVAGTTYFIVVEQFSGKGTYSLSFTDNTGGCREDCDDGKDNDADTKIDCADSDCATDPACCATNSNWYIDADGDGQGAAGSTPVSACTAPAGYVANQTDCNDGNKNIYLGAAETCNGLDDDCDNVIDDGVKSNYYADTDGDNYGAGTAAQYCLGTQPSGYVTTNTDCRPTDNTAYPGAPEQCDGVDDDCDGTIDDGVKTNYYADGDTDGYGAGTAVGYCLGTQPAGYVGNNTDCLDTDKAVNPGATEVCDLKDNDCDTQIDEGVKTTYYKDGDNDSYGNSGSTAQACSQPSGYVSNATDCNDTKSAINPAATEICDGVDNDCDTKIDDADAGVTGQGTWYLDSDKDAYGNPSSSTASCSQPSGYVGNKTDCDDSKAAVNPGATEVCNLIDDDCDTQIDENVKTTFYADSDNDKYGNATVTTQACSVPSGYVANSTDCDDKVSTTYPGATETCNLVDDDCDTVIDDGVKTTFYADTDNDKFGNLAATTQACSVPSGYVSNTTDCDDTKATVNPSAAEYCNLIDDDCDKAVDESAVDSKTFYNDTDNDTYGAGSAVLACSAPAGTVATNTDCVDSDATIYPGATEICDGLDNDCDSQIDDNATGMATWYVDTDGDKFGASSPSVQQCSQPSGYVNNKNDCDDTKSAVNPNAVEACNTYDDDCDKQIDEAGATGETTFYADTDGDTYGDPLLTAKACFTAPSGYQDDALDCNDKNKLIYPGATEVCDLVDNDCDTQIDEGVKNTYYADTDGDLQGNLAATTQSCTLPSGYSANSNDCNDTNSKIYTGATEFCNAIDDDCDKLTDEAGAFDESTWYKDGDVDKYGDVNSTSKACNQPSGYVADSKDCNDTKNTVYPGATELCNLVDDDCDGVADDNATDAKTWYADSDKDAYGDVGSTTKACAQPSNYVADSTDCNDGAQTVHPGATEFCNLVDDDCDKQMDENAVDAKTWYADDDKDLYGNLTDTTSACAAPSGYLADSTDCDDTKAAVNPNAVEACNGYDDDCDKAIDEAGATGETTFYADTDKDLYGDANNTLDACVQPASGFVVDSTDCLDTDGTVHPGALEVPYDGVDQDCADGDLVDVDDDGFVAEIVGGDDCDDSDKLVFPGATETWDGVDQNCEGKVDEGTDHYDDDGDGFSEVAGDCDDAAVGDAPGIVEVCDGADNDCDGTVDNGTICFDDDGDCACEASFDDQCVGSSADDCEALVGNDCSDGDVEAAPGLTEIDDNGVDDDCDGQVDQGAYDPDGDGYTEAGGDCAPEDGSSYPGAPEVADTADNDCDGTVNEGTEAYDDDGDGFTELFGDCDDADENVNTDADEVVDNGRDDDCDGAVDEGGTASDDDGDGYTENGGDCDDYDADVQPGAEEIDNDADDDCDGQIDEDYNDLDGDGYGFDEGDCDDRDGWTNPGMDEMCDEVDNNCNGDIDEGCTDDSGIVTEPGKCGCSTGGWSAVGFGPALLMLLSLRRRRTGRNA